MIEGMPNGEPTPEELQAQADAEMLASWLEDHPPEPTVAPEHLRECAAEVAAFEAFVTDFESRFSLDTLLAITTQEEAEQSQMRTQAKLALVPMVTFLAILKAETNISADAYQRLEDAYRRLSNAVGCINSRKVRHA